MTETFADAVDRLRDVVEEQVAAWQRLLHGTRAANQALRTQDANRFDDVLAEQVETLRELKQIESRRRDMIREVGAGPPREDVRALETQLRRLADEVSRSSRIERLVIERNGAMVEARLALHRRAGTDLRATTRGVDRIA